MRVASGVPGKATVRQSANAQSLLAMFTTPVRTPRVVSRAMEISVALVVSVLAGVRPRPGSDCVLTLPATLTKRAKVGEVTDEPSGFLATGTLIVSAALFGSKTRSPCQPLATGFPAATPIMTVLGARPKRLLRRYTNTALAVPISTGLSILIIAVDST